MRAGGGLRGGVGGRRARVTNANLLGATPLQPSRQTPQHSWAGPPKPSPEAGLRRYPAPGPGGGELNGSEKDGSQEEVGVGANLHNPISYSYDTEGGR